MVTHCTVLHAGGYFSRSCSLILSSSASWTRVECVRRSFRFFDFLVRMWLLKACCLLIFPEPVSLKRFLALDLVFILGICSWLKFISVFPCLLLGFGRDEHGHPLSFQFGHLFHLAVILQFLGQAEQQDLTLILVHDGPSLEKYIGL